MLLWLRLVLIHVTSRVDYFNIKDIARYINSSRGDYENMKQIEEVEQSLVDYRGVPLLQCGRYIFDGELRIRPSDQSAAKLKLVFIIYHLAFLNVKF